MGFKLANLFKKRTTEQNTQTNEQAIGQSATSQEKFPFVSKTGVYYPSTFEEVEKIISFLRDSTAQVVVSFENADKEQAQRFLDTMCGAVLALKGNVTHIANNVYLLNKPLQ